MLAAIATTGSSVLPLNPTRLPPHSSFNTRCHSRSPAMTSRSRFTTAFASANISKQSVDPTTTRRRALQNTLALPLSLIMLAPAAAEAEAPISKAETLTSASGVKYQIIKPGSGPTAKAGDYVTFDYVLRRSNGYFVYSTTGSGSSQQEPTKFARNSQEEPVTLAVGKGVIIEGVDQLLLGASAGERLRALVPPEVGYVNGKLEPQPPSFGPRRELSSHSNQPLFFEIEVRKVVST